VAVCEREVRREVRFWELVRRRRSRGWVLRLRGGGRGFDGLEGTEGGVGWEGGAAERMRSLPVGIRRERRSTLRVFGSSIPRWLRMMRLDSVHLLIVFFFLFLVFFFSLVAIRRSSSISSEESSRRLGS